MRHNVTLEGLRYRLRPIEIADAAFILELRTNPALNRYLRPTSNELADQIAWLERYFERAGDYYFVVEQIADGSREGVIGIYDIDDATKSGEWGRWILRPGSLAAVESAWLIYRAAFEYMGLQEIYCRTIAENAGVVSFHDSCGIAERRTLPAYLEIDGRKLDAVEHRVTRETWPSVAERLSGLARLTARRRRLG